MPDTFETHRKELLISTDPERIDLDAICEMLSQAYWAQGRSRELIARTLQYSLVFGVYDGVRQIGLARIVSDYSTFAWLCDVFIWKSIAGAGLESGWWKAF